MPVEKDLRKQWSFKVTVSIYSQHPMTALEAMKILHDVERSHNYSDVFQETRINFNEPEIVKNR